MNYTEIPTDLLVEVVELIDWINDDRHRDDDGGAAVKFSAEDMEQMEPLLRWLEYVRATWRVEGERDWEQTHRYCRPSVEARKACVELN
jgi:hypothetical protein